MLEFVASRIVKALRAATGRKHGFTTTRGGQAMPHEVCKYSFVLGVSALGIDSVLCGQNAEQARLNPCLPKCKEYWKSLDA